ncbi:MAG: UrcA family protein [Proteobacteria bacterium]|nr:UrcA family protein [Pseudomonadota bacterium]
MNLLKSIYRSSPASVTLVALVGLFTAGALPAAEHGVTVSYRDLDLTTPSGAHTLYDRIRTAARTVCGYRGTQLTDQAFWDSCYRGAITEAVAKVNNPLLTAVHTGRPADPGVAMLQK